jgi:hypothetical protein
VTLRWNRVLLISVVLVAAAIGAMVVPITTPRKADEAPQMPESSLFMGIDKVELTEALRAVFRQAEIDYERVRTGDEPSCKALETLAVSDGGTMIWVCPHYRITSVQTMADAGDVPGSLVGPMLRFEGMEIPISNLHFVSDDHASTIPPSPVVSGIDSANLTEAQRAVFRQAGVDYERVRAGNEPTCEVRDTLFTADGGSTTWVCPHYRITSLQTLAHVAGVPGFLVGPMLSFDGTEESISDLHFMTYAAMQVRDKEMVARDSSR